MENNNWTFLYLILPAVFAAFSGILAHDKNRNAGLWCLVGFFLGPFGLLVGLMSTYVWPDEWRMCPHCFMKMKRSATACCHCGHESEVPKEEPVPEPDRKKKLKDFISRHPA